MSSAVQERVAAAADTTIRMERVIPAEPGKVFDAWVSPTQVAKWWGPEGYSLPEHSLDVRPGGGWRTVMRAPDGQDHTARGIYRTIDRPYRLAFSWSWEGPDGKPGPSSEVTITLKPHARGTLLTLEHVGLETADSSASHGKGWESMLNDLERYFR